MDNAVQLHAGLEIFNQFVQRGQDYERAAEAERQEEEANQAPFLKILKSDPIDIEAPTEALKEETSLEIECEQLPDHALTTLFNVLRENNTVTQISIIDDKVSESVMSSLAEMLTAKRDITHLTIRGAEISDLAPLVEALRDYDAMESLNLSDNYIEDSAVKDLMRLYDTGFSAQHLNLSYNYIGVQGAQAVRKALRDGADIRCLHLEGNSIKTRGAQALAKVLRYNDKLEKLYLDGNEIGGGGAAAIGDALKTNQRLSSLTISGNGIGDAGASDIAEGLKNGSSLLSRIYLHDNEVGEAGAKCLLEALEKCYVTELTLFHNAEALIKSLLGEIKCALETNKDHILVSLDPIDNDMVSDSFYYAGPAMMHAMEKLDITKEERHYIYKATSGKCFESPGDLWQYFRLLSRTILSEYDVEKESWAELENFAVNNKVYTEYIVAYLANRDYLKEAMAIIERSDIKNWSKAISSLMQTEYVNASDNAELAKLFSMLLEPMSGLGNFAEWFGRLCEGSCENLTPAFAKAAGMCGISMQGLEDDLMEMNLAGLGEREDYEI